MSLILLSCQKAGLGNTDNVPTCWLLLQLLLLVVLLLVRFCLSGLQSAGGLPGGSPPCEHSRSPAGHCGQRQMALWGLEGPCSSACRPCPALGPRELPCWLCCEAGPSWEISDAASASWASHLGASGALAGFGLAASCNNTMMLV